MIALQSSCRNFLALAGSLLLSVSNAQAQLYWDSNAGTAGFGNTTGTWGTSNFWNTSSTGGAGTFSTATSSSDNVNFGAATLNYANGTVGVAAGGVTVGGIVMAAGQTQSINLGTSGNAITIHSGGITKNAGSAQLSMISPVTLGAAQTWTNNSSSSLLTSSTTNLITNSGFQLTIDGTGTTTFGVLNNTTNAALTGSGALVKNGTGRFEIGNNNTAFSGNITVNGGTLFYGDSAGALGTGNINITNGIIEARWSSGSISRAQGTGAGQIQITGGISGFSASQGNTFSIGTITWGSATFNPSEFVLQGSGNGSIILSNNINLNGANRTITSNQASASGNATFSGIISNSSGTAGLIKKGVGIITVSGANTYNGGTTISAGTLRFDIRNAMPATGTITVENGAALGVTVAGSGTTWGSGTGVAGIAGLTSTANSGEGYGGLAGPVVNFDGNSSLNLNVTANITESNEIGNGSATSIRLIKSGGSTLTLTGNNSYTGGTTVSAGALAIGSANAIPNTGTIALNGGTIQSSDATARTISNAVTIGGDFTVGGTGDLTFSNTGASALGATRTITVNTGRNATFAQAFSGSGFGITKAGAGTLTLTGNNTYTGATTISAGTVVLNNDGDVTGSAILFNASNTSLTVTGGSGVTSIWNAGNGDITSTSGPVNNVQMLIDGAGTAGSARVTNVNILTWGRTSTNSTLTLTDGGQMNVNGEIRTGNPYYGAGGNSDIVIGGGTATSTFTGNNQAFYIGFGERNGSNGNDVTVNSSGVLTGIANMFVGHVNYGVAGGTSTNNKLTVNGTGTASMTSITVGYAQVGVDSANANVVQVTNGGTLTTSGASYIGRAHVAAAISNSNTATVTGTGSTWNTSNQNVLVGFTNNATATSNTNILTVASGGSLTNVNGLIIGSGTGAETGNKVLLTGGGTINATTITVNTGNTLQFGSGGTTSSLSMTGNITNNGSMVFNLSDTITQGTHFDNAFGGTGSVTQNGTGTLVLNGANTYTGSTTISAGTLQVSGTGSINSTSGISVATGATFDYSSSTALTGAVAVAAGGSFHYSSATPLTVAPTLNGSSPNRAVFASTGPINLALTLDSTFDVLSPGSAPGIMEFQTNQTWDSFSYDWQLNDWSANEVGTNADQIQITGSLNLSGSSYRLNVLSLKNDNTSGLVGEGGGTGFSELDKTWTILTASSGIANFDANNWAIDVSGFQDADAGQWSISQVGNSLVLRYAGAAVAPIVNSLTSGSITGISATIGGTASPSVDNQNSAITERGVVYSITAVNNDPLIDGEGVTKITDGGTTGAFTIPITDLSPATNYSFKVYAITGMGTTYSTVATFDTLERAPIVILPTSELITTTSAILGATVSSDGGRPITERGVVYSVTEDNSNPLIGGLEVTKVTTGGTTGVFTIPVTDLPFAPLFSFRAYATNSLGTTYSAVFTFSTPPVPPAVSTPTKTSITGSEATLGGRVIRDNGTTIAERGVVYSITSVNGNPLIDGVGVTKVTTSGTVGVFTIPVTDLAPNTAYSFKAYAINGVGTTYTTVATFLTLPLPPTVILPTSAAISFSTATLGGTVSSDGGVAITERGVVYSLTADNNTPVIDGLGVTKVTAIGTTGLFTVPVTDLTFLTQYSFRAYATNSGGTSYTDPLITFTTTAGPPAVTTPTSASITATSATIGGDVASDGGDTITERGVVYSITSINNDPLIDGEGVTKATAAGATGVFTAPITDLVGGTTYSYKAYATNSIGTSYTSVSTFQTTVVAPVIASGSAFSSSVATDPATAISSATLGGNITTYGEETITRGVVYSLTSADSNPYIGDASVEVVSEEVDGASGEFSFDVDGLEPFKTYSFRAFVTNSLGTSYTAVDKFTTPSVAPIIGSPASGSITTSGATITANVTNSGGRPITVRGVVYSATNLNPLINGVGVSLLYATGTTGPLSKELVGLKAGTVYRYKAFATSAAGTNYTAVGTFTTSPVAPVLAPIPTHTSVTSTLATLGGNVTSTGGSAITERGVVYSVFASVPVPTTVTGIKATAAGSTGVFTKNITGLLPGTKYAYRAYATNAAGTTYSATTGTFNTLKGKPLISLPTDTGVSSSGATLGGTVTSDGGDTLTARGVVYSLTSIQDDPKLGLTGVKKEEHGTANSVSRYTVAVTGLQGGKSYSYRAYATNSKGTTYTAVGTFTTDAGAPTVAATPTKSTIALKGAVLGGSVKYSNGAAITERGVLYSLFSQNATPVLGDVGDDAQKKTATGALGSFSVQVSGLVAGRKYAFRAYAKNSEGTAYSSVGTFTTLEATASVLAGAPVGSAPSSAKTSQTYHTVGGDGLKYLTIVINKAGSDSPTVEVSGDLTDWFSGSSHTTVVSDDADVLTVRDNTPVTAGSKRYIRVKP